MNVERSTADTQKKKSCPVTLSCPVTSVTHDSPSRSKSTTVYVQHDSIDGAIQILNLELAKVAEWFDSNKLTLNVKKTQMLMMSRKKNLDPQGDVILRNEAIQRVTKAKFLGVIVDQYLNWKDHISMVSHKIFKSCGIISRIRNTLHIKSKKRIYYSLIHPYLTYCINVWSPYRSN